MSEIMELSFNKANVLDKEIISFHIPHSKKLNEDHKYFTKRIIWTLIKRNNTEDYPFDAIEEDEKNGVRYQEIPEQIITEVNGIKNEEIQEKINSANCFKFDFVPKELDRLILKVDYKYKEVKAINQPHRRGLEYISFTYKNRIWQIDKDIEKRVVKKSISGIVEVKRTHNNVYSS